MKRSILILAFLGSLLPVSPVLACPYDGYGYRGSYDGDSRMRHGRPLYMEGWMDSCMYGDEVSGSMMRGGMGHPAMPMGSDLIRLGLGEAQLKRVTELQRELNQRLTTLDSERVAQEGRLREMYADPSADREKTAANRQRMMELRRLRAEAVRTTMEQIDALLAPEQRARWRRGTPR